MRHAAKVPPLGHRSLKVAPGHGATGAGRTCSSNQVQLTGGTSSADEGIRFVSRPRAGGHLPELSGEGVALCQGRTVATARPTCGERAEEHPSEPEAVAESHAGPPVGS